MNITEKTQIIAKRCPFVKLDCGELLWVCPVSRKWSLFSPFEDLNATYAVEAILTDDQHSQFRKYLREPFEIPGKKYGEFKRHYYTASPTQRADALFRVFSSLT